MLIKGDLKRPLMRNLIIPHIEDSAKVNAKVTKKSIIFLKVHKPV